MPVGHAQCICRCHRLKMHGVVTEAGVGFGSKGWLGSLMWCCPPARQGQDVVGNCAGDFFCVLEDMRFREQSWFVKEQEHFRSVVG